MTVYKGSVAQSELSQGSNAFAEAYKGSQKIYGKNSGSFQLYNYGNKTGMMLGEISVTHPYLPMFSYGTIKSISGNFGQSGSTVVAETRTYLDESTIGETTVNYYTTVIIDNVEICIYDRMDYDWIGSRTSMLFFKNSKINSTGIGQTWFFGTSPPDIRGLIYPDSVDNSQVKPPYDKSISRSNAYDKIWTIDGLI